MKLQDYLLKENVGAYLHGSAWEDHDKLTKKGETIMKKGIDVSTLSIHGYASHKHEHTHIHTYTLTTPHTTISRYYKAINKGKEKLGKIASGQYTHICH